MQSRWVFRLQRQRLLIGRACGLAIAELLGIEAAANQDVGLEVGRSHGRAWAIGCCLVCSAYATARRQRLALTSERRRISLLCAFFQLGPAVERRDD